MLIYMENKKPKYKFGLRKSSIDDRNHILSFFEYEQKPLPLQFSLSNTKEINVLTR